MDNSHAMTSILTGTSPYEADAFTAAVAERFEAIKNTDAFAHRNENHPGAVSGYCYDGNRCQPENLGWRSAQTVGFSMRPELVEAGEYDGCIAIGFHEAASSEYYYRYEKDWG